MINVNYINYFFLGGDFFAGFVSFLRGKLPSKEQRTPRRDPQPSTSFNVTADEEKVNRSTQGSPLSRYSATFVDVKTASPLNSPVHAPLFLSMCTKKLRRSDLRPSRTDTRFNFPVP